jgi:hypothetical protein
MKRLIFLLALLIIAIYAWEDDEDECSVNFNNKHCGERGKECNGGTSCIDGHCACLNSHECNGGCVDIKYDVDHCGACDVKCSPNQICINGMCTCPNNDNACTNSPNEPCGRCNAGQYCDLNSSGGTCTCLNNDNACGPTCTACPVGQHCELVNGASKCISGACPNTPTACGNSGVCTNCASISPNSVCSNGDCACPQISTACGLNGACTDCAINGGVCSDGACACPQTSTVCGLNGACTDCTQNGTSPNSVCSDGACCIPSGSGTCTTTGDCCAGLLCDPTSSTCITAGCFDLNSANAFIGASCGNFPFTQAICSTVAVVSPSIVYHSLTYNAADVNPYCCIGYGSDYTFFPLTANDLPCTPPQLGNAVYGRYAGTSPAFRPPSSEYVFIG